jgi:hypothetical protein
VYLVLTDLGLKTINGFCCDDPAPPALILAGVQEKNGDEQAQKSKNDDYENAPPV